MKFKKLVKTSVVAAALAVTTAMPTAAFASSFEAVDDFGKDSYGQPDLVMPGVKNFECPELQLYEKVIFVGDSRTYYISQHVDNEQISFIALSGSKLNYLKSTAYSALNKLLDSPDFATPFPKAVVFNHGVNDLENRNEYMKFMKKIAPELKNKNCTLYYMSVNPVDNSIIGMIRPKNMITSFNNAIQEDLKGLYSYIDTYTYLNDTGFYAPDGLHYNTATNRKIFNYAINRINRKKPSTTNITWQKRGLYWYALNSATNAVYKNTWINFEGGKFYVDKNGRLRTNTWVTTSSGNRYYVGSSGRYYTNQWISINGKDYYLKSNGVMAKNEWIGNYYVGPDGAYIP